MICQPSGKIDCFGLTLKHPRFRRNADRFVIADMRPALCIHDSSEYASAKRAHFFGASQGQLLLVADGVGDRKSAARASSLVIDTFNKHLLNSLSPNSIHEHENAERHDLQTGFLEAMQACRECMQREIEAAERFEAMGAVLTLAYVDWPNVSIMHVGNNRAYHVHGDKVCQVTDDHTLAHRLVEAGKLSPHRASNSKLRGVIYNLIGTQQNDATPEFIDLEMNMGDAIMLCTDGMAVALNHQTIKNVFQSTDSAEEACRRLVSLAGEEGLQDDATLVVARFMDRADPQSAFEEAGLEITADTTLRKKSLR